MNSQDIHNLQEAYMEVCEAKVDKKLPEHERSGARLDRYDNPSGALALGGGQQRARREEHKKKRGVKKEQVDLYDIILSHLLDEGYAETPEAAEAIMVNMSEDWREDIVEFSQTELNSVSSSINQNTRNASIRKQQPGFQSSQSEPQRPTGVPIPGTARVFNTVKKLSQAVVGSALK